MSETYKIMFVCTGNTCRSPMAEGGMRKLLENKGLDGVDVFSSGTAAASGFPATQYAIEAARIWEADITGHRSRPLSSELIDIADIILTMAQSHCQEVVRIRPEAADKTYLLKNYPRAGCDGDEVDDPIGGSLDMYNQTFVEIGEELGRMLPDITEAIKAKRGGTPGE